MAIKTDITRLLDFELTSNKDIANGYAGLDGFGLIAASQIPDLFVKTAGDTMTGDLVMSSANIDMHGQIHMNLNYIDLGAPNCGIQRIANKLQFIDPNNIAGLYLDDLHKFIGMSDVPANYTGAGNNYVVVNAGETALEFVAAGAIPGGPYLPLSAGASFPLTGYLKIKTDAGGLYFYTAANAAYGSLYPDGTSLNLAGTDAQDLVLGTGAGKTIINHINASPKLTIADTETTINGPIYNVGATSAIYFENPAATDKGKIIPYDTHLDLISSATQDLVLDTGANTKNVLIKNAATTIATVTKDNVTITKPIYNVGATSAIYFENPAATDKGKIIPYDTHLDLISSATQDLVLDTGANTKNVLIKNAATTIATVTKDNVTMAKPIAMGTNKITGLANPTANGDAVRFEHLAVTASVHNFDASGNAPAQTHDNTRHSVAYITGADLAQNTSLGQLKLNATRYSMPGWGIWAVATNTALTTDVIYYIPIFVGSTTTFSQLTIYVYQAGSAGNVADIRIFAWNDGVPGALVSNLGTISTNSAGALTLAINVTLDRGLYFYAIRNHVVSVAAIFKCVTVATPLSAPVSGITNTDVLSMTNFATYYVMTVTSAYADPAPAPTGMTTVLTPFLLKEHA